MKMRFAICLAVAATAAGFATRASAQMLLPPYEITTSVRSMGLQPISRPVFRNGRYVLRAIDGRGYEMRVVASAVNGRILNVRPVGYRRAPAYAERFYPPARYPAEAAPTPPGYVGVPSSGASERAARIPQEPSVIYAPGSKAASQPSARTPSAAAKPGSPKPAAPKVAAKPAKAPAPIAAETSAAPAQPAETTAANGAGAENSLAVPPVQSLE